MKSYTDFKSNGVINRKTLKDCQYPNVEKALFLWFIQQRCVNRLPLLVLGKSKNPRCFKNHKLPVCYASSKKGWMNRDLFQNWFYNEFIPSVRKYSEENYIKPTALLIIDNAASHYNGMTSLESDDGLIKVLYLPPNCTALVQPMDQGVIYSTKSKYKRKFALSFLGDFSISYEQKLKQINLKDVVFWLAEAWNEVSNNIILHSWNVLLDGTEELSLHIEENINLQELLCKINPNHGQILTNDEINSWIVDTTAENDLEIYTDEEILAEVLEKSTHTKTNYADETFQDIDSEDEDDYEKLILTSVISKNINQSETINQSQNGEARSDPIGLLNANEDTHQHNLLVKIDNLIEYCEDSKYDLKDIFNLRNIRQKILQDIFNKY